MSLDNSNTFDQIHARSLSDPQGFWGEAAREISWIRPWDTVLDDSNPPFYRWFKGGMLNTCYNAVDRHVEAGHGARPAIIHDSPVTGRSGRSPTPSSATRSRPLAGALKSLGVEKGDRVVIYMPMIPQALVAMLASARLGAIHSVVFGGFAPHELATRINDARPRVVVSASCGIEPNRVVKYKPMLDAAIELSPHKPDHCVIFQRPMERATLSPRSRPRLGRRGRGGPAGRHHAGHGHRPALHPLHLGDNGQAEGDRPGQRGPRRGPQVDDEAFLQR